jgi:hypothetical protein
MGKQKVTVMICDNPECSESGPQIVTDQEPYAMGYHLGKGSMHHGGGGGPIPAVFACCRECILPALDAKIAEEWRR